MQVKKRLISCLFGLWTIGLSSCGQFQHTAPLFNLEQPRKSNFCETSSSSAIPSPLIDGYVPLELSPAGSIVQIYNDDGQLFGSGNVNSAGVFHILVDQPQSNFFVLVKGIYRGQPYTLRADVCGYTGSYIPVNPISTLISQQFLDHQGMSLKQAETQVKSFFSLTEQQEMGISLTKKAFDFNIFLQLTVTNGGVNSYLNRLSLKINQGFKFDKIRNFNSGVQNISLQEGDISAQNDRSTINVPSLGSMLAQGIAGSIVKSGKKIALGWFLNEIGIKGFDTNLLSTINKKITALENQVSNLKLELEKRVSAVRYEASIGRVLDLISVSQSISNNIEIMASYDKNDVNYAKFLEIKKKEIEKAVSSQLISKGAMELWNNAIVGYGGAAGIIETWNDLIISANSRFHTQKVAQQIQDHWNYIDFEQWRTLHILIEYKRMKQVPETEVQHMIDTWAANRVIQLGKLRGGTELSSPMILDYGAAYGGVKDFTGKSKAFPPNVTLDHTTGLMWYNLPSQPYFITMKTADYDAAFQEAKALAIKSTGISAGWREPGAKSGKNNNNYCNYNQNAWNLDPAFAAYPLELEDLLSYGQSTSLNQMSNLEIVNHIKNNKDLYFIATTVLCHQEPNNLGQQTFEGSGWAFWKHPDNARLIANLGTKKVEYLDNKTVPTFIPTAWPFADRAGIYFYFVRSVSDEEKNMYWYR